MFSKTFNSIVAEFKKEGAEEEKKYLQFKNLRTDLVGLNVRYWKFC
jgi:hypothetical protein